MIIRSLRALGICEASTESSVLLRFCAVLLKQQKNVAVEDIHFLGAAAELSRQRSAHTFRQFQTDSSLKKMAGTIAELLKVAHVTLGVYAAILALHVGSFDVDTCVADASSLDPEEAMSIAEDWQDLLQVIYNYGLCATIVAVSSVVASWYAPYGPLPLQP